MSSTLNLTEEIIDGYVGIRLIGMLDGHTVPNLEACLKEHLDKEACLCDLSQLSYISSAGVGVFINFIQQFEEKESKLLICAPSPVVQEIFGILGLDTMVTYHASIEAAASTL